MRCVTSIVIAVLLFAARVTCISACEPGERVMN
jgi:hypothetical protein